MSDTTQDISKVMGMPLPNSPNAENQKAYEADVVDALAGDNKVLLLGKIPVRKPGLGIFMLLKKLKNPIAEGVVLSEMENYYESVLQLIAILRVSPYEAAKLVCDKEAFEKHVIDTGELLPANTNIIVLAEEIAYLMNDQFSTKANQEMSKEEKVKARSSKKR